MRQRWYEIVLLVVFAATLASAQTAVTTTAGGTLGKIPVFSGSSNNIENSILSQVVSQQSSGSLYVGSTSGTFPSHYVYGSLWVGTAATNGGITITSNQAGGTPTVYYTLGYRFGQDSATFQRGLYYDQQSGRVSVINTNAAGAGLQTTISERFTVLPNGNVGVGTTSPGATLEVDGNLKLTSGSGASVTFSDGTVQSTAYTGVTCGGDYAESVDVDGSRTAYEPGDLMVLSKESGADVVKSSEPYSTMVAGIYSTKPGIVGRRQTTDPKSSTREIPMAMVGIVPAKVSAENGPIQRGDLLVSSSIPGYAMKGTDRTRMLGAVLGKAMGSLDSGTGVIEVLVTLQ